MDAKRFNAKKTAMQVLGWMDSVGPLTHVPGAPRSDAGNGHGDDLGTNTTSTQMDGIERGHPIDSQAVEETVETLRRERDEALADCTRLRADRDRLQQVLRDTNDRLLDGQMDTREAFALSDRIEAALIADPAPGAE